MRSYQLHEGDIPFLNTVNFLKGWSQWQSHPGSKVPVSNNHLSGLPVDSLVAIVLFPMKPHAHPKASGGAPSGPPVYSALPTDTTCYPTASNLTTLSLGHPGPEVSYF